MKRFNKIKTSYKIIALAIIFSIFSWIFDAFVDSTIFFKDSFLNELLLPNNSHEIYMRIIPVFLMLIFAFILAKKVSNLKKIQKELRENREWLNTTIRSIGDAVIATDNHRKILLLNKVAEKLTGWNKNEALGRDIHEIFHIVNEYTNEKVEIPVDKVLIKGEIVGLANHTVLISKDGKRINIDDSAAPIKNDDGEIIGVILTFQDVTEKKRIYRELQESEEKYKNLFEFSPFPLLVHQEGKVVLINKASVDFFQAKDKSELLGLDVIEFIHPDYREIVINRVKKVYKERQKVEPIDEKFITLKGNAKDVSVLGIPYTYKDKPANLVVFQDITERKIAERKIKESEEKFRAIFDNIGFGSSLLSPKGKFLLVNKGWEIISGYSKEELQQMKNSDLSHPDDNEATAIKMKELFSGKIDSFSLEKRIIRKGGEIRYGILTVKPLIDSNGNSIGVVGLFVDITDRKIAEIKLKESEEKYKQLSILKNAILESPQSIIVFALDKNYRYLDFTLLHKQTMKAIWGVDIEVGENMPDYIKSDDDREKAKINFDRALKGESLRLIEEYGDKKLQRSFYENIYNPVFDEENNIIGVSVFVIDITERKKLELSLKERNKFLNSVFESITHPFYIVNVEDYSIAAANPATMSRADYYDGITCYQLTHYSDEECNSLPEHPCPIEIIKKTKKPVSVIHKHYDENKVGKFYEINAYPIFDEDDKLIQIIESSIDITDKILAEEKIRNINIELEQKVKERTNELNNVLNKLQSQNEALRNVSQNLELSNNSLANALKKEKELGLLKSQFVSMVSHEYRTPLTIILTSSELLENFVKSNDIEKIPKLIDRIQVSVSDMEKMLEDVLLLGKSDKGLISLKYKEADLIKIVKELITTINVYIDTNREIIINNHSDSEQLAIKTDVHYLKQIIQNIILNAHKYSPKEKPLIIDIFTNSESSVQLDIIDFGKGISDKDIDKIFDPFYRNKDNIGSIRGHGLGLSIVKSLADALNIQIRVSSELGKGSKFSLYIPCTCDKAPSSEK